MIGQLGSYRIEEPAGEGGLGVLYRARQHALERTVALEVIEPALRERAERAARILGSIEHPHLPGVYEAGEADGRLFVAWRWVDGTDLARCSRAGSSRRAPPPCSTRSPTRSRSPTSTAWCTARSGRRTSSSPPATTRT